MENRWKCQVYFVLLAHNFIGGKGTRLNWNQFVVIWQNVKYVLQKEIDFNFWLVVRYRETMAALNEPKTKHCVC